MAGCASLSRPTGCNLYNIIGIILFFGLFFGMYKKSRICAIMLLIFSIIHNIYFIIIGTNPLGIIIDLLITFFFAYCVYGTFVYHKIINFKLNE
jgi:hypothetical protein